MLWLPPDHGCVLRITRQVKLPPSALLDYTQEVKNYLVPPIFHKRNDAKLGVCMQALSNGFKAYIETAKKDTEARITNEMKKFANSKVFPLIGEELKKMGSIKRPVDMGSHRQANTRTVEFSGDGEGVAPELVFEYPMDIDGLSFFHLVVWFSLFTDILSYI
jgi:hypothetical protein